MHGLAAAAVPALRPGYAGLQAEAWRSSVAPKNYMLQAYVTRQTRPKQQLLLLRSFVTIHCCMLAAAFAA